MTNEAKYVSDLTSAANFIIQLLDTKLKFEVDVEEIKATQALKLGLIKLIGQLGIVKQQLHYNNTCDYTSTYLVN